MPHDVPAPPCRHRTPTGGIVDQCGPPAAARSRDGDRVDVGQKLKATAWAGRELVDRLARQSPARLAIVTFGGVILVFTGLLSLPAATSTGTRAPFIDALFTATSSVCVTGLVTVPTGTYWSGFGQAVILLGMQVGGLGVMTLASILGAAVSRRIGLTQKLLTAS